MNEATQALNSAADHFGPTAAVLIGMIAVGLIGVFLLARWARPWVEKAAQGHLDFLITCANTQEKLGTTISQHGEKLSQHGEKLDAIHAKVDRIHTHIVK